MRYPNETVGGNQTQNHGLSGRLYLMAQTQRAQERETFR
jgi:hypothetical protein